MLAFVPNDLGDWKWEVTLLSGCALIDLNTSKCLGMTVWLELAFILLVKRVFQELLLK